MASFQKMKRLSVALILLAGAAANAQGISFKAAKVASDAKTPEDIGQAVQQFLAFQHCNVSFKKKVPSSVDKVISCVKRFVDSEVPQEIAKEYALWLIHEDVVGEVGKCPAETEAFLRDFKDKPPLFLCLTGTVNQKPWTGFVYFTNQGKKPLIHEIKITTPE
jgi:hypothetical protein